jgi:cytochrome c oxidase subunit 2
VEIANVANKGWSVLFGVTMVACGVGFAISPFMGWWMPEGVSTHAWDVDFLFYVILGITAFFFFLTEGILVAFMWLYSGSSDGKHPVSHAAEYPGFLKPLTNLLHDQHRVELAWTFVPAVILLYIAFAQVTTWANIKYTTRNQGKKDAPASQQLAVSARQFEWRMRYPSVKRFEQWMKTKDPSANDFASFGKVPQADDIYVVNEMHVYVPKEVEKWKVDGTPPPPVVVHLSTRDVIHSLNLPNFRVKQDALPGKLIPVFFTPTKANCKKSEEKKRWLDGVDSETGKENHDLIYDIPCAELCGWGHYRMIGRVYVHKNQEDYMNWLIHAEEYYRQRDRDSWEKAEERIQKLSKK